MLRIQISNEMDNTIEARITIQEKTTLWGLYDGTVLFIFRSFFLKCLDVAIQNWFSTDYLGNEKILEMEFWAEKMQHI